MKELSSISTKSLMCEIPGFPRCRWGFMRYCWALVFGWFPTFRNNM